MRHLPSFPDRTVRDTRRSIVQVCALVAASLRWQRITQESSEFETLERAPAYRIVEEAVRKKILDRELAPGELLPSEIDLAEQLGVTL